jgi:hypothetical protein
MKMLLEALGGCASVMPPSLKRNRLIRSGGRGQHPQETASTPQVPRGSFFPSTEVLLTQRTQVQVQGQRGTDYPKPYEHIHVTFVARGPDLDPAKVPLYSIPTSRETDDGHTGATSHSTLHREILRRPCHTERNRQDHGFFSSAALALTYSSNKRCTNSDTRGTS